MEELVGRKPEIKMLDGTLSSRRAELIAVYGRRRIGKTFLISNFYRQRGLYFEMTGIKHGTQKRQIQAFFTSLSRTFKTLKFDTVPNDWFEAFFILEKAIQNHRSRSKIILFFDEFPWMETHKSDLVKAFEYLWNSCLSKDDRIITILCGSSVSWMIRKVIRNKAGLHGRLTLKIRLKPFNLSETEDYFKSNKIQFDRKQLTEIFMSMGGVPKYLSYVVPGLSGSQNIQKLCFDPNGPLATEFDELYESLFDNCNLHTKIIDTLAEKRYGLTYSQIAQSASSQAGGNISKTLKELVASDFVQHVPFFGKRRKDGLYRIVDEYSVFYLNWIKQALHNYDESLSSSYWLKQHASAKYKTWAGYVFECVCLKHLRQIIEALKLSVVVTHAGYWNYISKDPSQEPGAQVDLVIDRADQCIHLCEIKFYNTEYKMTAAYAKKLNDRRELFREKTKTRKTIFNTLITPYGAINNQHYLSAIDQQLRLDDLFV